MFTSECNNIGLTVDPSVDILPAATRNRLQLDVLRPSSQTLLWQLWLEAQPEWTHCAWPCTFWIPLGRMTALRTHDEWEALSQRNRAHVRFCTHALRNQATARLKGSGEQLAGAISLNKKPSGDVEGAWFRRICVSFLCMGPLWASLEENVALVFQWLFEFPRASVHMWARRARHNSRRGGVRPTRWEERKQPYPVNTWWRCASPWRQRWLLGHTRPRDVLACLVDVLLSGPLECVARFFCSPCHRSHIRALQPSQKQRGFVVTFRNHAILIAHLYFPWIVCGTTGDEFHHVCLACRFSDVFNASSLKSHLCLTKWCLYQILCGMLCCFAPFNCGIAGPFRATPVGFGTGGSRSISIDFR